MKSEIRLLLQDDPALPGLAALMQEMQAHYQVFCPPHDEIIAGLASRPPAAEILIYEDNSVVMGFAAFSAVYPGPGLMPGIFLKEIYVSGSRRDGGVGKALMRALAHIACSRDLSRIDWTADSSDTRLISFYERLGGVPKPEKLFFRLHGKALKSLAD